MPLSESILNNTLWNKFSLKFNNLRLEAHYQKHSFPQILLQSRLALLLGAMMYEMYGILDFLLIPKEMMAKITLIRISATMMILMVFGLTFFRIFKKYHQQMLAFILVLSGSDLLLKMTLINQSIFSYYFSGLLLLFFWAHAFYVLSFTYLFISSLLIVVASVISFITIFNFSYNAVISYLFILFSAFGVSVFSSYVAEKRGRALFLREKELDRERYIQRERATHDSLTNLPNRVLLLDRIDQAILDSIRHSQVCAGFYLDLDNFKNINDIYGHAAGDYVLTEVAKRLKASTRAADTVARLSGDEFFILTRDIHNVEHAEAFGHKLLTQIKLPYHLQGKPVDTLLSASIGICMFPYDYVTALDVIDKADQAMYQVKLAEKSGITVANFTNA